MRTIIAIPARYGSSRLHGKPLLDIGGEPMIVRVWKRCRLVAEAERVVVATDDDAAVVFLVLFNHDNLSTLDELEPAAENTGTV